MIAQAVLEQTFQLKSSETCYMLKGETFAVVVRLLKESGCKFLGVDSENGTPGFVAVNINSPAPPIAALTPTPVIFETSRFVSNLQFRSHWLKQKM